MPSKKSRNSANDGRSRSRSRSGGGSRGKGKDAIALLRADHAEVTKLFQEFGKARSESRKADLSSQICIALSVHTCIEEEIFYPAAREALKDKDGEELIPEAKVEHATVKEFITELESAEQDEMFAARMQVLSEYVKHHVKEEQNEMFPKIKKASGIDLKGLGAQLQSRKDELMAQLKEGGKSRPGQAPLPSSVFSGDQEAQLHPQGG